MPFIASAAKAPTAASTAAPAAEPSLSRNAATRGRYFGAAARFDQIAAEPRLRDTVLRDCAWVTPEIHMKWDATQPAPGRFSFQAADELVAFARRHDLRVRGHALLWEQSTPAWTKAALKDGAKWSLVSDHISAVAGRYGRELAVWDVVNEPIDDQGRRGLRTNSFLKAFGPDYIRLSLEAARTAAPAAQLAINDYGFDYDNTTEEARRRAFVTLLTQLKTSGAPLHAVGIQAHLDLRKGPLNPRTIAPFLQEIADLGLKIAITELDVREHDFTLPLAVRDQKVADEVRAYLDIVLDQPAVEGVITWGLSDRHSWLQDHETRARKGYNRGLPYDDALAPKPMYWALHEALSGPATA